METIKVGWVAHDSHQKLYESHALQMLVVVIIHLCLSCIRSLESLAAYHPPVSIMHEMISFFMVHVCGCHHQRWNCGASPAKVEYMHCRRLELLQAFGLQGARNGQVCTTSTRVDHVRQILQMSVVGSSGYVVYRMVMQTCVFMWAAAVMVTCVDACQCVFAQVFTCGSHTREQGIIWFK